MNTVVDMIEVAGAGYDALGGFEWVTDLDLAVKHWTGTAWSHKHGLFLPAGDDVALAS